MFDPTFNLAQGVALSGIAASVLAAATFLLLCTFTWAALAPFETLAWWAGWFGNDLDQAAVPPKETQTKCTATEPMDSYVLFFSGVGSASSQTMSFRERGFLAHLQERLPQSAILDDIFPFSVNNVSLTEQPFCAPFWRWSLRRKQHGPRSLGKLINLRNIFQICTSIDARYGPLYNWGVARSVLRLLARHQYEPSSGTPVVLVASSGAAQMALGVVPYLKAQLHAPVYVIAIGGVFGSDPGLLAVDHFYHIYGSRDTTVPWGWLDSRRWPIRRASAWNRALRQGRVTRISLPGVRHNRSRGYFDCSQALPDGHTRAERTALLVADLIQRHEVENLPPSRFKMRNSTGR